MFVLSLDSSERVRETADPAVLDVCLRRMADGDVHALDELYRETHAAVYAYVLSVLKNTHDAEDVLHDCYLAVYQAADGYRTYGKPMAWMITIAKNLCLMKLRERKKNAEVGEDSFFFEVQGEKNEMSPEDCLILNESMNELSDEERQIVVLHAVSGFRHREIAAFLQMPLPTVLSKYNRALKKLKKSLSKGERET
ncbi:MAG: RNA polymerase sigma factor [Eubacteriales bacterium]